MVLRKIDRSGLGRRLAGAAGVAVGLLAALPVAAQYPGQVAKSTKDAPVLRAISVLEWTGEAGKPKACRIVPVAVLDGGKLQDGGVYLSRPEPIALAGEVEYELQQNGQAIGLFDIENSGHEQGSWVGYGKWKPKPAEKPQPTAAELEKSMNDDEPDSDKPVLHRKKHPGEAPADGKGKDDGDSGKPAAADDPDRPKLHKKESADAGSAGTASGSSSDPDQPVLHKKDSATEDKASAESSSAVSSDPDRPLLKKGKKKEAEDIAHVDSVVGATDPDRPTLKRGQSTGYKLNVIPSLMGLPEGMQQTIAVSDAKPHPDHPWSFTWANPEDEGKMKSALEDLARTALGLGTAPAIPPAAAPVVRRTPTHKSVKTAAPAPAPAPLVDEQFRVFELSFNSGATLVFSAQTDGATGPRKFVTIVAQPDLYGQVRVLLKSVTDTGQLDENPRMRLIDAVDALADNRGELLFELRGASQRQFVLYRVWRGQAEKLFATAGGEYGTEIVQ